MKAMILEAAGTPLVLRELPIPVPGPHELLLRIVACGVCRTDLHVVDGELPDTLFPMIPGHEIVGIVVEKGQACQQFSIGQRVGVPWLGTTCGHCRYCVEGQENLCDEASFTGYTRPGGYAEYTLADERYCFALPETYTDANVAPLLCAGLIGYRALAFAGDAGRLGIYGFGAAAHIVAQIARAQGREIFAFTKPGDRAGQDFARTMGAHWAGGSDAQPPEPMDAAIIFAPVGSLVPHALRHTVKGGVVICAGIHMSDIPSFPYAWLWGERSIRSVANLTRADGEAFFALADRMPIHTEVETFPLPDANLALARLREGRLQGAAVLCMNGVEIPPKRI